MIEFIHGQAHAVCDGCGEEHVDGPFDSFEEARSAMKSDGWSATKVGEDWINLCPTCQEDD